MKNRQHIHAMKQLAMILTAALMLAACGSKKAVVDTTTTTSNTKPAQVDYSVQKSMIANTFGSWRTLQTGGSIAVGGAKSLSSSMSMKMERGKSIYISVRPMGIMEVAKLVIKGDTLIVVDKIHKRYLCENVSLLTNGIPADVSTVQDIFLGRAFMLGKGTYSNALASGFTLKMNGEKMVLAPEQQEDDFDYEFVFDKAYKILSATVMPADAGGKDDKYTVNYSNVKTTVAGNVPHALKVSTVISGARATLSLEFKDLKWNESVNIDTSLPKNYERMKGSSLLRMLGSN